MSDSSERFKPQTEDIEDAVVVGDDTNLAESATVPMTDVAEASESKQDPRQTSSQPQQVVYVRTPVPPAKSSNRGLGVLIAVLSGLVFFGGLTLVTVIVGFVGTRQFDFGFLREPTFYIPTLFFVIGFVLLTLLANRANWWAYIFGSIVVGVFVYFGSIGLGLLADGIILDTPREASVRYAAALANPFAIVSALLARELSLWAGSLIARRGRKLKLRDTEARAVWEREVAQKRAGNGADPETS